MQPEFATNDFPFHQDKRRSIEEEEELSLHSLAEKDHSNWWDLSTSLYTSLGMLAAPNAI